MATLKRFVLLKLSVFKKIQWKRTAEFPQQKWLSQRSPILRSAYSSYLILLSFFSFCLEGSNGQSNRGHIANMRQECHNSKFVIF